MVDPPPPPPDAVDAHPRRRGRILGIDLARALAIVGMLAVHVGPTRGSDLAGRLYALPHGRASVLFVLVAGIGASILARSRRAGPAHAVRTLAWRAVLLLPVGLLLQELDHRVFVILQTYGLLFLLAIPAIRLPDRALATAAAVVGIVGPVLYLSGVLFDPGTFDRTAVRWSDEPGVIAHRLLLSGPYPLVVWSAPFLLGMWIGRRNLRKRHVRRALIMGGAAALVVARAVAEALQEALAPEGPEGWTLLLAVAPHSQMPLWLLGSSGAAALVVGVSLWLGRVRPRAVWPLAALGQLALTVYVAHLLALHAWSDALRSDDVGRAAAVVLLLTALAAGGSALWRARFRRGPLETFLRWPPGGR